MNKGEKKLAYERKAQKLVEDINAIMDMHIAKVEQSKQIMSRLRGEYIYAKNSYIKKFDNKSKVTIEPYCDEVKPELEESDEEGMGDDQYCKIPVYSFGPFNRTAFLDNDIIKIVWIIKEPFCEDLEELRHTYYNEDSDYYDQAKSYCKWENLEYQTHINIVKITKIILTQLLEIEWTGNMCDGSLKNSIIKLKKEDLDDFNQVMNHICILEVNHFPGMAFNIKYSKDDKIGEWAEINAELTKLLLSFYKPYIVIGGYTLGHFFPDGYKYRGKYQNHAFDHILNGIEKENKNMLATFGYTSNNNPDKNLKIEDDYLFESEQGCIFIDSSHPSRYSINQSEENGKQIRAWFEIRMKTKLYKDREY